MQKKLTYGIISLNVRGIREQSKRRSIFLYESGGLVVRSIQSGQKHQTFCEHRLEHTG